MLRIFDLAYISLLTVAFNPFQIWANGAPKEGGGQKGICLDIFDISNRTIIKSTQSLELGAKYLGSAEAVRDRNDCELQCCNTPSCNIAIFHQQGDRDCYLFDCGKIDDFKCIFSVHDNYIAMGMMVDRSDLEKTRIHEQAKHEMDLNLLKAKDDNVPAASSGEYGAAPRDGDVRRPAAGYSNQPVRSYQPPPARPPPRLSTTGRPFYGRGEQQQQQQQRQPADYYQYPADYIKPRRRPAPGLRKPETIMDKTVAKPQSPFTPENGGKDACGDNQWRCRTGQCVAVYDLCNGIAQCVDGSDEDSTTCTSLQRRRPDVVYTPPPSTLPPTNARRPAIGQSGNSDSSRIVVPAATNDQRSENINRQDTGSVPVVHANSLSPQQQQPPPPKQQGKTTELIALQEKNVRVERVEGGGGSSVAALLLGVGLCVLALFLVHVSCRLRAARRSLRKRRGKQLHTDEGDMLMNGLYL